MFAQVSAGNAGVTQAGEGDDLRQVTFRLSPRYVSWLPGSSSASLSCLAQPWLPRLHLGVDLHRERDAAMPKDLHRDARVLAGLSLIVTTTAFGLFAVPATRPEITGG